MKYNPHDYQKYATNFVLEHHVAAIFLNCGMGKSVITLTAINELLYNSFEIRKVLVIAPLRVARDTWPAEIEKWDHLKGLTYSVVIGTEPERKEALRKSAGIYLINRENVDWLINKSGFPFDFDMYGLMLASWEQMPSFKYAKKQLCDMASLLERKASIPQIKAKLPLLQEIHTDPFWAANDIFLFEQVRRELRELIKFLEEAGNAHKQIFTKLGDPIVAQQEGSPLDAAYDFEDYRKKVSRYVNEHGDTLAIYKLTHNMPLSSGDYEELERVLTSELGSREDYVREFGETPFGLLVRKIAKLDHDAAMQAFSQFINDESLNQKQIAFVHKIIHHVELNGYMENVADLTKPPFDKPVAFIKLFDAKRRAEIVAAVNAVKDNAIQIEVS